MAFPEPVYFEQYPVAPLCIESEEIPLQRLNAYENSRSSDLQFAQPLHGKLQAIWPEAQ